MKVEEESEKVGLKLNLQKTKIMVNAYGNSDRLFLGLQNHCRWWLQPWNEKTLVPWKKSYDQSRQHITKQRHSFADKGLSSQGYGFPSSHVWMWVLDYQQRRMPKNWCFWTVVLEKTLESPLDCKEIQLGHPKGYQSWIFTGSTDAEAETPVLWPPDVRNWLIGKDLMLGKMEGRRTRGWQRMRWSDGITESMDMTSSKLPEVKMDGEAWVLQSMGCHRVRHDWVPELNFPDISIFSPDYWHTD